MFNNTEPIYELTIKDNGEQGVDFVSFVSSPAIERNFQAFSKNVEAKFEIMNDEKREVYGAAMIPNMLIPRSDKQGNYSVFFSTPTIKSIAINFFKNGYQNNVNIGHDPNKKEDKVTFFQSWVSDSNVGIKGLNGDYPDGTWFLGAKVENEELWSRIKSGELKGFSVEGYFSTREVQDKPSLEEIYSKIEQLINLI